MKAWLILACCGAMAGATVTGRVDALFGAYRAGTPGCALAVMKNFEIVYSRGYGMADLEHDVPITPKTVFYVGSMSKQFTAFAIALLVQEGRVSLSDPVRKYIPELPDYGTPITIDHLIHHTSGIRDYNTLLLLSGRRGEEAFDNRDVLDMVKRQSALNFQPGTQFLYSNSGYTLLAILVERVTGKPLSEFAAERIFRPLDMRDTHIHDDLGRLVKDRAMAYIAHPDGRYELATPYVARSGAGGVLTTLADLRAWDQNFYDAKVGGKRLIEEVQTPQAPTNYGFGLMSYERAGLRIVGHGGALGGFRAAFTRFPAEKFSVACLCNERMINPDQLALQVAEIYLGKNFGKVPPPGAATAVAPVPVHEKSAPAHEALERFAGRYFCADLDATYELTAVGDGLKASIRGKAFRDLTAAGPGDFKASDLELKFDAAGFRLSSGRVRDLVFVKR